MPFYFFFARVQLPHAAGLRISEVNLFIHGLKAMQCVAQDLGGQERMTGDIEGTVALCFSSGFCSLGRAKLRSSGCRPAASGDFGRRAGPWGGRSTPFRLQASKQAR